MDPSRTTLRVAIAAVLYAGLQGCGGGSSPPPPPPVAYSISGTVSGAVAAGATVTLSGASSATAVSSATGAYTFTGLQNGAYTVTPSLAGYTFTPASTPVTISGRDVAAINFASAAVLAAPSGVTAAPGNGTATVSWPAAAGATGYNVYSGTSPQLTTSSTKVSVSASPALITGLSNGTAYYFAVSSLGATGETALSAVPCAVPTAADTAGLTLHDPLCGARIDGTRWQPPGEFSASVLGGAALLAVSVSNQESRTARGVQYSSTANLVSPTPGQRVTTLAADISVPAASAARSGNAEIRASVRLLYSPPASRLLFPGALLNLISVEAGLMDAGSGLKAYRVISHCDDASCATVSKTGLGFTDTPGLKALDVDGLKLGDSADHDAAYRVTVWLEETTGVFHWSITGGKFGTAGIQGLADPADYLAATPAWQGIPPAGAGFFNAQISARTLDGSTAGGGSGAIAATFRNVWAGFNDAAPALFDDFSGTGTELSAARWAAPGINAVSMSGGGAALRTSASTAGATPVSSAAGLTLANPSSINTVQADVRVTAVSAAANGSNNVFLQGTFYNTGIPGTAAPNINQPNSAVGDVLASVFLQAATNDVVFSLMRLETANGAGPTTQIARVTLPGATVGTSVHTLRIRWDPAPHTFTFGFDGQTRVIDPTVTGPDVTVAAPVAKAANWPMKRILAGVGLPNTAGLSGSTSARVNDVFTAP